uniref:Lepb1170_C2_203 n=1 Tax=Mycobacterium leprae TaxID=1769 RepID=Q49623_MYCLR|nr:Lepb1170_C2_203 [Mycobacterium leprae]
MRTVKPSWLGCSPLERWPAPGCTVLTVWRPTACWKAWWSVAAPEGLRRRHAAAAGRAYVSKLEPVTHHALKRRELQRVMSRDAAVMRNAAGLQRLSDTLAEAPIRHVTGRRDFEDVALTLTARAVAAAALARNESRGCHHCTEYPDTAPEHARSTVIRLADDQNLVRAEALATVG